MDRNGRRTAGRRGIGPSATAMALLAAIAWGAGARAQAVDEPLILEEVIPPEATTAASIELKARGLFRPSLAPDAVTADAKMPKPLDVDIETRLVYRERILKGPTRRALRLVKQAATAINGEIRPVARQLRPELALLLAERRATDGSVAVVSPSGSLTRGELELVEGVGDTLCLGDLLPEAPASRGASWPVRRAALWAISGYDAVTSSTVQGSIESVDGDKVHVALKGEVKGSFLGAEGTIRCQGRLIFDRKTRMVEDLKLDREESRRPGDVEAGLDLKSTLTIERRSGLATPPELSDAVISKLSPELTPARLLLQLIAPDGRYNLLHDRTWHTYWDDRKLVVLKKFADGRVKAQCNLIYGPTVPRGKHQDLKAFEEDVRRGLAGRFGQVIGGGEVDGDPEGNFRYKLGVQGRQGELGLVWYYYLIASPRGDQLLSTFTLADSDAGPFGQEDESIIGSLQWNDPPLPVDR